MTRAVRPAYTLLERQRIVQLLVHDGKSSRDVRALTGASRRAIFRFAEAYRRTGHVAPQSQRVGRLPGLTDDLRRELVDIIIESPWSMLSELLDAFEARTGVRMHLGSLSKIVRQLGISRKRLRSFARKRDEAKSLAFKSFIVMHLEPEMLFFIDETAKDRDSLRRDYGSIMRCAVWRPSTRVAMCPDPTGAPPSAASTSTASSTGTPSVVHSTSVASWRRAS